MTLVQVQLDVDVTRANGHAKLESASAEIASIGDSASWVSYKFRWACFGWYS